MLEWDMKHDGCLKSVIFNTTGVENKLRNI